ncbi:transmembrane protein DUF3566 [Kribbella antiqua]|uniref:Transmembrane protein DUF3566 n=1 Tax=Kribbella antiqua TaxID=2512217 RepID=A0A4R2INP9_9ACTN|nr:DUF3566 domain-containing protein [Kribbella antiqua]TCO46182.1 transmembrane protein DUF3566 [Kribbella antiqua]
MTNRARPTWPEGAADNPETQRPSQGGNKQSTTPGTPASNGRSTTAPSGNGQQSTPNGQRPGDFRPQPRPQSGAGQPSAPVRPPQQPPVRPAVAQPTARPASPVSPGQVTPSPSTPGQPWTPSGATAAASSYGVTGKKTETFGDKVNAARQAVLDKAAAVKDAATPDQTSSKPTTRAEKAPKTSTRPQTRKARLRMSRIDPWSVMKTSFLLSIAFGIVTWVAVFIVWSAIGAAGVFDNINNTVTEVLGTPAAEPFRIENYINTGKVMGFTTLLACADVLIITALATLGSFLYNIAATLLGGLEVTLASED